MPLSFVEAPFLGDYFWGKVPTSMENWSESWKRAYCLGWEKRPKRILYFLHMLHVTLAPWILIFGCQREASILLLIVHFLNNKWEPYHVTMGFFETIETIGNVLALQVNDLFAKHKLTTYVLTYVKDEGNNFSTMTSIFTSIVSC